MSDETHEVTITENMQRATASVIVPVSSCSPSEGSRTRGTAEGKKHESRIHFHPQDGLRWAQQADEDITIPNARHCRRLS